MLKNDIRKCHQWIAWLVLATFATLWSSPGLAKSPPEQCHEVSARVKPSLPPKPIAGAFSIALTGDLLGQPVPPRGAPTEEERAALNRVAEVMRRADVGFANFEGSMFGLSTFVGTWAPETGGGYLRREPWTAPTYKAFGIDIVGRANNHATDWGIEGMLETSRTFDAAEIAEAGGGVDGKAARAPGFLQTELGTIGLVSVASTFTPMSLAGEIGSPDEARPGLFGLRAQQIILVTHEELAQLKAVASRQSQLGVLIEQADQVRIGGQQGIGGTVFRASDRVGQTWEVNAADRKAILDAVAAARRQANFVIFTIHAHERDGAGNPADFLRPLFHEIIDAGADVIVRHGAHYLHGIEIYKDRPIFYDLNALFSPLGSIPRFVGRSPADTPSSRLVFDSPENWSDTAIATPHFNDGKLDRIEIQPLTLIPSGTMRGMPEIATGKDAARILAYLQEVSAPYGTHIEVDGDIGVIDLATSR